MSSDGFTLVSRRRRAGRSCAVGGGGGSAASLATSSAPSAPAVAVAAAAAAVTAAPFPCAAPASPLAGSARARARARRAPVAEASASDLAAAVHARAASLSETLLAGELQRLLRAWLRGVRTGCACPLDVLALGLGSFGGGGAAGATAVQAALLLLLVRLVADASLPPLPAAAATDSPAAAAPRVTVFDPAMSATDCAAMRQLGFDVISSDDAGGGAHAHAARRCSCAAGCDRAAPLLAFLPHCDAQVHDAVLRANASDLPRLCLVGNSLSWYHLAGNFARRGDAAPGSCGAGDGDCSELARLAALAEVEGEGLGAAAAAADRASGSAAAAVCLRPIETPLPLSDADEAVERALSATSVHVFVDGEEGVR